MEKKVLPFEIDSRGYFPADTVSLSILKGYRDQKSLLYGFYNLFAFECYYMDGNVILNVELNWECPVLSRKEIPRSVLQKSDSFSLIEFLISCIDEKYYIYFTIDSSKIKCYSSYNSIDFAPHPLIIYGYNKNDKKMYMADFTNGMHYKKQIIDYEEIIYANNSLLSKLAVLDPLCGTNESILDIELIKYLKNCNFTIDIEYIYHSIYLFLMGKGEMGNSHDIIEKRLLPRTFTDTNGKTEYYEATTAKHKNGIAAFWQIIEHYKNCLQSAQYRFNYRHVCLINTYYGLFIEKLEFLLQNNFFCKNKKILKIVEEKTEHKKSLDGIVLLAVKFTIRNNTKNLALIIDLLEKEIMYIEKIHNIILCELKK